jgi:hypothetical protein
MNSKSVQFGSGGNSRTKALYFEAADLIEYLKGGQVFDQCLPCCV